MHLDVIGSDAMVTIDVTLLATPEAEDPNRGYRVEDMSTYLSRRFNLPATSPPPVNILSPVRDVVLETVPQVDEILTTLAETVDTTQPTTTVGMRTSVGQDVEVYLADLAEMVTRGCQVMVAV